MNIRCTPSRLCGNIAAISSKSDVHRLLICAALSDAPTKIYCNVMSKDISAMLDCINALGAEASVQDGAITVIPRKRLKSAELDCGESGTTLRFIMPVAATLGMRAKITAHGRLPERPLSPLKEEMERHGVCFETGTSFPLIISGQLTAGEYTLAGNVSSQFISGLLFALPLLEGDSIIRLIPPVESRSYLNLTLSALGRFGIEIAQKENAFIVKGGQKYRSPVELTADGDWSNSAFFLCAGAVSEKGVSVTGLDINSPQGDKKILDILRLFGAQVTVGNDGITVKKSDCRDIDMNNSSEQTVIDASDIPDLVPVAAATAAMCSGKTVVIKNAERLRLKESDRLASTLDLLTRVGARAEETSDGMIIFGGNRLTGGEISGYNDHRIVMSAAVISCGCHGSVDIIGAKAVEKTYPDFFEDFTRLGGNVDVINDGQ